MAKYSHLKGQIPELETPRDHELRAEIEKRSGRDLAALTAEYNDVALRTAEVAYEARALGLQATALEILIRQGLDGQNAEAMKINGYTWSSTSEPLPNLADADLEEVIEYLRTHEMGDLLRLNKTELTTRIKNIVKEEALANELEVRVVERVDPETGEAHEETTVHSRIPGVKVYLKPKLGRRKSSS